MSQQGHWYSEGAPPLDQPVPPPTGANGWGIAGFVVGLVGLCGCGGLLSPIGLLLSVFGLFRAPRGWAVAGAIVSALGCCCLLPVGVPVVLVMTGAISVSALVIWVGTTFQLAPPAKTALHATVISTMIAAHYGASQTVPQELDELDLEAPVLVDGWGKPFDYKVTDRGGFILRSAGGDGTLDTGDDFDMEGIPNGGALQIVTAPRGPRAGGGTAPTPAPTGAPNADDGPADGAKPAAPADADDPDANGEPDEPASPNGTP